MNSAFNTRLNNTNLKTGNVEQYFKNLQNLIQINDGERNFQLRTVDCHDQSAPFNEGQETRIAITHSDFDITQLTDGFLTFLIRLNIQILGLNSSFNDPNHLCKIATVLKSTNTIMDQLEVLANGRSTGYQQNEMVREGFAYSTIKPHSEKKTKKYTHSLYENVENMSESIAGIYLNLDDFKDGLPHPVEFELNLPVDDLLCMQAFDQFINRIIGEIELKFYVRSKGFVWCSINPEKVKDYKLIREGIDLGGVFDKSPANAFLHQFTQIGNEANGITNFWETTETVGGEQIKTYHYETGKLRVINTGMSIQMLKSSMFGYTITDNALNRIKQQLTENPLFIPSQELEYNAFPLAATSAGIQSTVNMPLNNVSCISVMFPKHDNDYTVFENPIYDNVQLTVNGRNIPDQVISTQGARFLQYQLIASDLSSGLRCTKEYEDSLTMPKNDKTSGIRYKNPLSDGTSFMINFQCERSNAGYTFDGYDSDGQNVSIQFRGQPIFSGIDKDTYYYLDPNNSNIHPPPPQIWLCRDTYFIATPGQLVYVKNGSPPNSQSE